MAAEILSFPSKGRPAEQRLSRAMQALDAALADQRTAIATWQDSLKHLQRSVQSIRIGLCRYHTSLRALAADVAALNLAARNLEAQADLVLRNEATPRGN